MPETTPATPQNAISPSFCAKAAAFALAVSVTVFLAAYLAATLPEKFSGWQAALPTQGMDAVAKQGAAMRARYLHEAEIRPRLIRAGFLSPDDLNSERDRYYSDTYEKSSLNSDTLTRALWNMRSFPELHKAFLDMLLDGKTTPHDRAAKFYLYGGFLAELGESLANGSRTYFHACGHDFRQGGDEASGNWFTYYCNAPRPGIHSDNGSLPPSGNQILTETAQAAAKYDAKLALARRVLPIILEGAQADVAFHAALDAKEREQGKRKDDPGAAWNGCRNEAEFLEEIREPLGQAVLAMWRKTDDPGFLPLAEEILASGGGTFLQRAEAVPLMAEKPGLPVSEYLFWQKYKKDLASVTACVGTAPRHYGYILGCMGDLMAATADMLKAQGTFVLGGQTGPGVTITRTEDFTPGKGLSGGLYLLADMQLAMKDAPEYDFSRAVPIFRGMLYRHMVNQPQVMPLTPKNPKDAAIIKWYEEKGWAEGHALLFSAVGSPEDVARHWATTHLVWWPDSDKPADAEPDLAYYHPVSGHFMAGMLPMLKGPGVSRFLGPITGLWFGRWNVDKNGWVAEKYEARPEETPLAATVRRAPIRSALFERLSGAAPETDTAETPAPKPEGPPAILLGKEILDGMNAVYRYNYRIVLARSLNAEDPDPALSPMDVFSFADNAVTTLNEWGITRGEEVNPAAEYLWRFRANPEMVKRIRDILSQKELRPYERLRKVRHMIGLSETVKEQEC